MENPGKSGDCVISSNCDKGKKENAKGKQKL